MLPTHLRPPGAGPGQPAWSRVALGAVATNTSAAPGAWHLVIPAGRVSALLHSRALDPTQAPAMPGSCTCSHTGPRKCGPPWGQTAPPAPRRLLRGGMIFLPGSHSQTLGGLLASLS